MCLFTGQLNGNKAIRAWRRIVCYKTARICGYDEDGNPILCSLYFNFMYRIKHKYICDNFEKEVEYNCVTYGFHSFSTFNDAASDCDSEQVIVKCVIPAGSLMYVSFDEKEYCSNKIKVLGWKRRDQYDWNPVWKNWHSPNEPGKIGKFFKELKKNIKKHTNPCA